MHNLHNLHNLHYLQYLHNLRCCTDLETLGPIDRTPGIPGSDKNMDFQATLNMVPKKGFAWVMGADV